MKSAEDKLIYDEMSVKIIETTEKLVTSNGARNINVRQVLKELEITNRVFYNRFHNIKEVLDIVYRNTIMKMRESIPDNFEANSKEEFFNKVTDIVVHSLMSSYDYKMKFNQYVFENDSLSKSNTKWWCDKIKYLLDYAIERGYVKQLDSGVLSYSIWCFVRGYNTDAVGRNLPREQAVEIFKYGFGFLLEGIKQ